LDGTLPPPYLYNCDWCAFLEKTGKLRMENPESNTSSEPNVQVPSCPQCGGSMSLKRGKYGEFWSCLKYPDCDGTRNP